MLFGTPNVSDLSFASINSTAENQRLKLSALICGLSAADNRCHSCAHFLSIAELLTVLHKCHTHWCVGNCSMKPRCDGAIARCDPPGERGKKKSKTCKYEGKRTNARSNITVGSTCRACALSGSFGELLVLFILADKVSQKCSQLIHMRFVPVLASGLETRNRFQNRQEKNKLYFSKSTKNFLTKKLKRACAREKQNGRSGPTSAHAWPPPIGNRRGELPSLIAPCAALLS